MKLIYILLGCAAMAACKASSDSLEEALQQAGTLPPQLEAVLSHFKNDPQRYEAANFQISNLSVSSNG